MTSIDCEETVLRIHRLIYNTVLRTGRTLPGLCVCQWGTVVYRTGRWTANVTSVALTLTPLLFVNIVGINLMAGSIYLFCYMLIVLFE